MNRKKCYGVWNTKKKEFQFGICEPSKTKARKKLFEKIGKDAYKYRFQIKELKLGNPKAEKLLRIDIIPDDDCPCNDCALADNCDGWEAQFCCVLCEYYGNNDCDNCDPMDI